MACRPSEGTKLGIQQRSEWPRALHSSVQLANRSAPAWDMKQGGFQTQSFTTGGSGQGQGRVLKTADILKYRSCDMHTIQSIVQSRFNMEPIAVTVYNPLWLHQSSSLPPISYFKKEILYKKERSEGRTATIYFPTLLVYFIVFLL